MIAFYGIKLPESPAMNFALWTKGNNPLMSPGMTTQDSESRPVIAIEWLTTWAIRHRVSALTQSRALADKFRRVLDTCYVT